MNSKELIRILGRFKKERFIKERFKKKRFKKQRFKKQRFQKTALSRNSASFVFFKIGTNKGYSSFDYG